ncbi:MAG TPA: hypothetical protein VN203_25900 [Candidatus Acidoferrum sp.]|nr:hypothetical protein [Candidatus Acidoferrum sp.]
MANDVFLLALGAIAAAVLAWGFRTLPQEDWQIAAAVPIVKDAWGHWHGLNLTYYGVFQASAYTAGVAMMFVLLGAVGVPLRGNLVMAGLLLLCCIPASTLVARLVERKRATFTVAGAVFVAILMGPWVFLLANRFLGPVLGFDVPLVPALAAASIGYALGEGVGRLACVSFGCCYGKPLSRISPRLRRLFDRWSFVFSGQTKKVSYEGGLEGEPLVPIQAITAVLYVTIALGSAALFLHGFHRTALCLSFVGTQAWRLPSETLRADYRGGGKISAYQVMAMVGMVYALSTFPFLPSVLLPHADILSGLRSLWSPGVILLLQGLWLATFLYTGRSVVTGATLTFHVRHDMV